MAAPSSSRLSVPLALAVLLLLLARSATPAGAQDTLTPRDSRFIEGLHERGYHDLAREFIDQFRQDPATSPALRIRLDYEDGLGLLMEAEGMLDFDRRRLLLDQAQNKFTTFVKANPDDPLAPEANVQISRILFERGLTAAYQSRETAANADQAADPDRARVTAETFLTEARASFAAARASYDAAIQAFRAALDAFPPFLPNTDPRKARRETIRLSLVDADIHRGLVDYEEALTYPPDSPERNQLLDTARERFRGIYESYRTFVAGFYARLWQGKCYEEKGDLGAAMGIYKELNDEKNAALVPFLRKVMYFQIIVDRKRGEHALAVERANTWLAVYRKDLRTDEGGGVQFELARNLLAIAETLPDKEKDAAIRRAVDILTRVVRYFSPFKSEAVALLRKYKPSEALKASEISRLTYDDAFSQAETALATRDYLKAIALLRQAIKQANPALDPDRANRARFLMSYCSYEAEHFNESAILADHIARHYPKSGLAPRAAEVAMASFTLAYTEAAASGDTASALARLVDICQYTAATWPDTEQADVARATLGDIALGEGSYDEAVAVFTSIRPESTRRPEAEVKAGDALWRKAFELRVQGKNPEADAEIARARALMESALTVRRERKIPLTDAGMLTNLIALAEIARSQGQPETSIELLQPAADALGENALSEELSAQRIKLLTILLRANLAVGQPDAAIALMNRLETIGASSGSLTSLYFELGRVLKAELDSLARKNDPASQARYQQTREAYTQFLQALADSQSGQTYDSLRFAADSLVELGQPAEALKVLDRALTIYGSDPEFQNSETAPQRLAALRLKKVEALQAQQMFPEAMTLLDQIQGEFSTTLDPMMQRGDLLTAWAEKDPRRWSAAYAHWKDLSAKLQRGRPRRIEYYETVYQMARCLEKMNKKASAISTLKSVLTLSPSVGNPEMKKRFETLLQNLQR